MADDTPKQPPRRRGRRALRVLRAIGLFLLCLILLPTLLVGALLLFAHTDPGQRWITSKVNEVLTSALAPSGLTAHIDALTGSLPSRLGFQGLIVADADGPWLVVDQAQLNMGWSALRKRQFVVRSIRVDHPALTRLPHLTERPQTESAPPFDPPALLAKLADWPDWLPSLAVENMDINGLALGPDVAGEAMTLSLHGAASASAQNLQAALSLRRDDKPGAEQAEVRVSLRPDAYLTLSLALAETSDGLLVRAVPPEIAKAPALRLLLQGAAPLADWRGDVHLDLLETDTTEMSGTSVNDREILALKGGLGASPLETAPRLNWNLTVSTGKASIGLWRMAGQKNGRAVTHLSGQAVLERPIIAPDDTKISAEGDKGATLKVQGHLNLDLSDMEWATPRLTALAGPDATLGTDYAVEWRATSSGASGRATDASLASPGLDASLRGLALKGQALSARGDASWHLADLNPLSPASALAITLEADVTDTSGLALPDVSPQGPLELRLRVLGPMSGLNADLTLDGGTLALREEALEKPHVHLSAVDLDVSALTTQLSGKPPADPAATGASATGRGVVEASVRARGLDVNLNSRWEVTPGRDSLTAAVHELSIRAAGLHVDGDVSAVLPVPPSPGSSGGGEDGAAASAPPALSGALRAEVTNWNVLSGLTGVPLRGGKASLTLTLAPEADGQRADAALDLDSLRVDAPDGSERISITKLRGTARVADAFRAPRVDADVGGGEIRAGAVDLSAVRLNAKGPMKGPLVMNVRSKGDVEAEVDASWKPGEVTVQTLRVRLSERFVRTVQPAVDDKPGDGGCPPPCPAGKTPKTAAPVGPWGARLLNPALIRYGADGFSTPGLDLALDPSGTVHLNGALNAQSLKLTFSVDKLDLGLFRPLLPALPEGLVQAQVSLTGTPDRPGGGLVVHLDRLQAPGSLMPPVSCTLEGTLKRAARGGGTFDAALSFPPDALRVLGAKRAGATLSLPLTFTADGLPRPAMKGALRGEAVWEGDIAPLWNFVPLADRRLTGQGDLSLNATGSLERPELTGRVQISRAAYEDLNLGLLLTGIDAEVNLDKSDRHGAAGLLGSLGRASLALKAGDGMGGTLTLNGTLDPVTLAVEARGGMDNLKPLRRQDLRINLSGDATVTGTVAAPDVKASITVNQGELALKELPGGSIAVLPISDAKEKPVAPAPSQAPVGTLNVEVTVPNRFFVRGHGLDSDWKGQVRAQGSLNAPAVVGNLTAARGTLDLLNRTFTLSKGIITFDGGQTINPRLDIVMTYTAANFQADVNIGGTASHPQVNLSSKPAMPQDEIIAQVMFGRSAGKLGRLETLQLAGAAAALAGFGDGGGGVFDLARKSLGVDVLRLGSSDNDDGTLGGSTLEVGKYVSDKVYVGISQGLDADSTGAVVDVDLTRHITLEARTGSTKSEVGVEWSYDY